MAGIALRSPNEWHVPSPWHHSEGMTACGTKRGEFCHYHYIVKMLRGPRTNKAFFGSYLHCFVARQEFMEVSQIVEMQDAAAKLSSMSQSVEWKV